MIFAFDLYIDLAVNISRSIVKKKLTEVSSAATPHSVQPVTEDPSAVTLGRPLLARKSDTVFGFLLISANLLSYTIPLHR